MLYKLILLQFIAHLLGDFIFQSHNWTIHKKKKALTWYHLWHALVIFFFSYLLSFDFGFFKAAVFLTIIHFLTDVLKSYFQLRFAKKDSFYFFIDQLLHLGAMVLISYFYYSYNGVNFIYDIPLNFIVITAGFLFCAKPSNIVIKNIFISMDLSIPTNTNSDKDDGDLPNAGKLIGLMERFLVLALILVGQYSAVGLIIAAKSILRFSDNKKNEYVLIGTMLSFGIATILGILISLLLAN